MLYIQCYTGFLHKIACNIILQDKVYENKWEKKHFDSNVYQVFCLGSAVYRTINLKGSSP